MQEVQDSPKPDSAAQPKKTTRTKRIALIGVLVVAALIIVGLFVTFVGTGSAKNAVYLYMCGSTLESKAGAASKNLSELLEADIPADTTVVVETGGTTRWRGHDIPANSLNRYIVRHDKLELIESLPQKSMGSADTLTDFLTWCEEHYPAENETLIFWDHGLGSEGSVCFDEAFNMDALTPSELVTALDNAGASFTTIGFDACLMASLDTAALLAPYADYMIASQEIEPAGGWNYQALGEALSGASATEEFAKEVCETYLAKASESNKGAFATLSVFDLDKVDEALAAFDALASDLNEEQDGQIQSPVIPAARRALAFGANSESEGYSNMIDLQGFANALANRTELDSAAQLSEALNELVIYKGNGDRREGASGVSIFYPNHYNQRELADYLQFGASSAYNAYLQSLFDDIPSKTIEFVDRGSIAEDGSFQITLTPESRTYLKSVDFILLELEGDAAAPTAVNQLGSDNDMISDWETLNFRSNFRGFWPTLNGEPLNSTAIELNGENIIFSAPVLVNGRHTNLRFSYVWDGEGTGHYEILGLWDGLDEHSLASKEFRELKAGDEVTILSSKLGSSGGESLLATGPTVTIGEDGGVIAEAPLEEKNYQYIFVVTDIFGNKFYSSTADFVMDFTPEQLLSDVVYDALYAGSVNAIRSENAYLSTTR